MLCYALTLSLLAAVFAVWVDDNLLSSADFFQNLFFFQQILSRTLLECQKVWIQPRTDILSILILVQTVYKGYQQTKKVATSKQRVKYFHKYR